MVGRKKLKTTNMQVVALMLRNQGWTLRQIAKYMGCSNTTIYRMLMVRSREWARI